MAEIGKYRAKRIDNGEEIIGYPAIKGEGTEYEQCVMCVSTLSSLEYAYPFYLTDYEIDPSTIERVEDGCEYCNGIEKGDLGKALDEVDTEGEMRLYRTAADTWYIRSRRHTDDGDDLFSLFDTDRCFKCGKQLKGVEGK